MKGLLRLFTVIALIFGVPMRAASGQETGLISGWALADGTPVRHATASLRDIQSGQVIATTSCDDAGVFAFVKIPIGTYVVEVVCASGALIGASAPVSLTQGAMAERGVDVDANAAAAKAAGAGSCLGLGLLSKANAFLDFARRPFANPLGIVVLGAAAASGVAAIVATQNDASASR